MKKKSLVSVIFFLALVFLLIVTSAKLVSAQKESQTIKIGGFNPRTGPIAFWGLNTDRGVDLCADQWNKKGGVTVKGQKYNIEMIHEDDKGKPEEAVKAANKLIFTDKVKFIAGPMTGASLLAAAPLIEANKIVTVCNSWAIEVLKNRKYIFRSLNTIAHFAPAFFKFVNKVRPDLKTSVHVAPNTLTGWTNTQADNDSCHALGMKVLGSEFFELGTQDFTSMLARIIPLKPDFINLSGTPGGISALIIKQARELGYKGAFLHSGHLTPEELGPIAGWENAEGVITSALTIEGPACPPALKRVYAEWIAKYGQENAPGFSSGGLLYDSINIICWAIEKANSLDPDEVRIAIENQREVDTIFGKGYWGGKEVYGTNHQIFTPHLISQIKNRKLVIIGFEMPWEVPPPEQKWR